MKRFFRIGAGVGALAAMTGCGGGNAPSRPNIVFFFADDIGTECFGCYGGVEYETPCVDSLARVGIQYMNMNAQPLSSPSRVQALTGLYNDRNYVAFGYMNEDEHTFAQVAREAGYGTAIVGKWQLGRSRAMLPKAGFDEFFCSQVEMYLESRGPRQTDRYANSMWDNNGKRYDFAIYGPDAMQDYAFDYIDRKAAAGEPFLLYYTEPLVHTPHTTTPDTDIWDDLYESRFTSGADTSYFKYQVRYMDRQVGNMVQHLKEKGLWDNTVFIFASDNGTSTRILSRTSDGQEVRGGKGEPNYRGTHVPMIIAWGDRLAGRKAEHLADLTDILPTIADIVGVKIPEDWELDGVSLYPEICGGEPNPKPLVLVHFNPLWPTTPSPKASRYAMDDEYACFWDGRIYNYREDPEFTSPLMWDAAPAELQERLSPLKARVDRMADFYPDKPGAPRRFPYKTFYDFAPPQNPF
ncbi:MAG: sulfatase-like hydrolase/transferase [Bacteroidales bacterium]|nr:sulfatase-like hydrolase/transferase [Bacteroidales bacterium]